MTNQMYSIYDEIIQTYNLPFTAINDADAMRMFYNASLNEDTTLHKSPTDFTLYYVAEYNSDTGSYNNITPPKQIIKLTSLNQQNQINE